MGSAAMDTVEILRRLVGFDTTSHRSNRELTAWSADYLESHGARIRVTPNAAGDKENVLASFGPDGDGGIVLSGHTDVVPAEKTGWSADPFTLAERDDRLVGRGTADMKGFIAACLAAAPAWRRAALTKPIHVALSFDEEITCLGVPLLIDDMLRHVGRPALAVIGEPTEMRIGDRHRGFCGFCTTFKGRAAHSSDPSLGRNAIAPAAALTTFLLQPGIAPPESTISVNLINGGTATNIVPEQCRVMWECRPTRADDGQAMLRKARAFLAEAVPPDMSVSHEQIISVVPLDASANGDAAPAIAALGGIMPPVTLHFGTEAGIFQQAGIPSVVCGPGSIAQAHQVDEWIARSELVKADQFMANVGRWAARA
jgi:acetylornithine deacetylase